MKITKMKITNDTAYRALTRAFNELVLLGHSDAAHHVANAKHAFRVATCATCASPEQLKPSHNGSKNCTSGSIASGGSKAHCSCDTCF